MQPASDSVPSVTSVSIAASSSGESSEASQVGDAVEVGAVTTFTFTLDDAGSARAVSSTTAHCGIAEAGATSHGLMTPSFSFAPDESKSSNDTADATAAESTVEETSRPRTAVVTGEEEENKVDWAAKMFRQSPDGKWGNIGGDGCLRMLVHKTTGRTRLVFRSSHGMLYYNEYIHPLETLSPDVDADVCAEIGDYGESTSAALDPHACTISKRTARPVKVKSSDDQPADTKTDAGRPTPAVSGAEGIVWAFNRPDDLAKFIELWKQQHAVNTAYFTAKAKAANSKSA